MYVEVATQGETFEQVIDRANDFLKTTAEQFPTEKIIVVTHGFTVKAMALAVLQPKDLMSFPEPENTSVTKITVEPKLNRSYLTYYNRQVGY